MPGWAWVGDYIRSGDVVNKHRHPESGKLRCAPVYIQRDKPQGGEFNSETQREIL